LEIHPVYLGQTFLTLIRVSEMAENKAYNIAKNYCGMQFVERTKFGIPKKLAY
jgi:hypothetical protein